MRRLPALLLLAACSAPPTEAELSALLLAGDLAGAQAAAQRIPEGDPLLVYGQLLQRHGGLAAERDAIHRAERDLLADAAEAAIAEGRPGGASGPLRAGLATYPDDPRFGALRERLERAANTAPPDLAASAYGSLAAAFEEDPPQRDAYLARHRAAALKDRYSPTRRDQSLAGLRGLRRDAAAHLLARIDAEYVVEVPWDRAIAGGQSALSALSAGAGPQQAWPGLLGLDWSPPQPSAGLQGALAVLDEDLALAQSAGLPPEVVLDTWVEGALGALDPWTRAVWPAEIASWTAHHAGVSVGVGLDLDLTPGGAVRVLRPQPDSPAWAVNLHQDDVLVRISDERGEIELPALDPEQRLAVAEAMLAGEPGSSVEIGLLRGEDALHFTVERAAVRQVTVEGYRRASDNAWDPWLSAEDGLAWVRILSFRDFTEAAFDALLDDHLDGINGLILDLRGNPGGDVNAAVQIGDRFVAEGLLAQLAGRVAPDTGPDIDPETGKRLIPWNEAVPGHALEGVPVVVLVDEDTASAAEILAGLLQERAGALIVGEPTWGKGLAQALRTDLDQGYAVQFTNQVWALPSGRRLSREIDGGGGIQPDWVEKVGPGEAFQIGLQIQERVALVAHADGSPMRRLDTRKKDSLPPLSEDPAALVAELLLRAEIARRATP